MAGPGIYLTFDDGPHPENTPRILDALANQNAKATFFVQGQFVVKYPEIARRIVADGHSIAGHSWSHRRLPHWAVRETWHEFWQTRNAIRDVVGVNTELFRPPYGLVNLPMLVFAAAGKLRLALWSIDSDDDRTHSIAVILSKGRETVAGDIMLCHDDNEAILKALPELIREWRNRGLQPQVLT